MWLLILSALFGCGHAASEDITTADAGDNHSLSQSEGCEVHQYRCVGDPAVQQFCVAPGVWVNVQRYVPDSGLEDCWNPGR